MTVRINPFNPTMRLARYNEAGHGKFGVAGVRLKANDGGKGFL
jgi:hypothetical protein